MTDSSLDLLGTESFVYCLVSLLLSWKGPKHQSLRIGSHPLSLLRPRILSSTPSSTLRHSCSKVRVVVVVVVIFLTVRSSSFSPTKIMDGVPLSCSFSYSLVGLSEVLRVSSPFNTKERNSLGSTFLPGLHLYRTTTYFRPGSPVGPRVTLDPSLCH